MRSKAHRSPRKNGNGETPQAVQQNVTKNCGDGRRVLRPSRSPGNPRKAIFPRQGPLPSENQRKNKRYNKIP